METYVFKVVYWDNGTKDKECYIEASSKTKAQKVFAVIYPDSNFKSATEIVIH